MPRRCSDTATAFAVFAQHNGPGHVQYRTTVQTGMKDEEPNRVLLASVGTFVRSRTGMVVIGGDMQMAPEQLQKRGSPVRPA